MSNTILIKKGQEINRTSFVPKNSEPIWITDTKKLYVGDGITSGGVPVVPLNVVQTDQNNNIPFDVRSANINSQSFVFEGDSITAGFGLPTQSLQNFPRLFMSMSFAKNHGLYVNSASGGSQISSLAARYDANIKPFRPNANGGIGGERSYLFLLIGTNDLQAGGLTDTQITSSLISYILTASNDGFTPIVGTILPRMFTGTYAFTASNGEAYRLNINNTIRDFNFLGNGRVIDYAQVLNNPNDTVLFKDGLHPDVQGHKLMAEYLNSFMIGYRGVENADPSYFESPINCQNSGSFRGAVSASNFTANTFGRNVVLTGSIVSVFALGENLTVTSASLTTLFGWQSSINNTGFPGNVYINQISTNLNVTGSQNCNIMARGNANFGQNSSVINSLRVNMLGNYAVVGSGVQQSQDVNLIGFFGFVSSSTFVNNIGRFNIVNNNSLHQAYGAFNSSSNSSGSSIYGNSNILSGSNFTQTFGTNNTTSLSDLSDILGQNNRIISSFDSTIIGDNNFISGSSGSYIIGNNATLINEPNVLLLKTTTSSFALKNDLTSSIHISGSITTTGPNTYLNVNVNGTRYFMPLLSVAV